MLKTEINVQPGKTRGGYRFQKYNKEGKDSREKERRKEVKERQRERERDGATPPPPWNTPPPWYPRRQPPREDGHRGLFSGDYRPLSPSGTFDTGTPFWIQREMTRLERERQKKKKQNQQRREHKRGPGGKSLPHWA